MATSNRSGPNSAANVPDGGQPLQPAAPATVADRSLARVGIAAACELEGLVTALRRIAMDGDGTVGEDFGLRAIGFRVTALAEFLMSMLDAGMNVGDARHRLTGLPDSEGAAS